MYSRPVDSKQFKLTAITTLLDWPTILRDGERWLTFTGLK